MTTNRPFTLIAALIFLLMALVHVYRLITHFQIILGSHEIPMSASYVAIGVTAILAVTVYRESQR